MVSGDGCSYYIKAELNMTRSKRSNEKTYYIDFTTACGITADIW